MYDGHYDVLTIWCELTYR